MRDTLRSTWMTRSKLQGYRLTHPPTDDPEDARVAALKLRGVLDSAATNAGLLDINETPRDVAFCAHAIQSDELLEVRDATLDTRFAHKPLVIGQPGIRFYAGMPLRLADGHRVGHPVRRRPPAAVDDPIAKLGFVPNPMARALAGGRTMSIGVLTQAIDSPFYGVVLRGIEGLLEPLGYSPLFFRGHWNAEAEARRLEGLRSRRVDGIIVLTGRLTDSALTACAKSQLVVVTGRALTAPNLF